ncbi:APC family permease [Paenarthrobacter sp. 2TAF44]|uniref:APC family permease n=1 Tax=Paenarthrobacter sp. 2TAF44 TaxID=3233018 RepID=UPI003F9D0E5D
MTQDNAVSSQQTNESTLRHGQTSLFSVTVLGLSAQQIGPGVALAGGYMIVYAGDASWVSMLIALIGACTIGAMVTTFSRRLVATGGLMSYVASVLGPYARALVGAGYILGILIAVAAVVTGVVIFSSSFLVEMGIDWAATPAGQALSAVVIAVAAGAIAYRGVDASVKVSAVLSFIGIPFVIWVTVAAAGATEGYSLAPQFNFSSDTMSWDTILQGTLIAMAYFVGFEGLSAMAGETKDPKRNVPRLVVWLLGITGSAYILILWFQIPSLGAGLDQLAAGESPAAVLAHLGGVEYLAAPLDLLLAAATFAGLIATFNYGSRIVATAASAGLLPHRLSHIHKRHRSPSAAVFFMTFIAAGLPIALQFVSAAPPLESSVYLYTLFSYCYLLPYVVGAVAAVVLVVREDRSNPVLIAVFVIGGAACAYLLYYALTSAGEGIFGALPWIALALTAVAFLAFVVAHKRRPAAEDELSDLL